MTFPSPPLFFLLLRFMCRRQEEASPSRLCNRNEFKTSRLNGDSDPWQEEAERLRRADDERKKLEAQEAALAQATIHSLDSQAKSEPPPRQL